MSATSCWGDDGVIDPARDVEPGIGGFQKRLGGGGDVEGVWNKNGVFEGDWLNPDSRLGCVEENPGLNPVACISVRVPTF